MRGGVRFDGELLDVFVGLIQLANGAGVDAFSPSRCGWRC